jgi:hypothetical protein
VRQVRAEASLALRSLRIDAPQLVLPLLRWLTATPIGTGELRAYGVGALVSSAEPVLRQALAYHMTAPKGRSVGPPLRSAHARVAHAYTLVPSAAHTRARLRRFRWPGCPHAGVARPRRLIPMRNYHKGHSPVKPIPPPPSRRRLQRRAARHAGAPRRRGLSHLTPTGGARRLAAIAIACARRDQLGHAARPRLVRADPRRHRQRHRRARAARPGHAPCACAPRWRAADSPGRPCGARRGGGGGRRSRSSGGDRGGGGGAVPGGGRRGWRGRARRMPRRDRRSDRGGQARADGASCSPARVR